MLLIQQSKSIRSFFVEVQESLSLDRTIEGLNLQQLLKIKENGALFPKKENIKFEIL